MDVHKFYAARPMSPEEMRAKQDAKLRQAAEMYEQQFLGEMVKAMRKTVHRGGGVFKPSFGQKIYEEKLDQRYVKAWADHGGIGLADMIYKQLKERMFPDRNMQRPQGPLPLEKSKTNLHMKIDQKPGPLTQVWFRGDATSPLNQPMEVTSPWQGRVVSKSKTPDGWNHLQIAHDNGTLSGLAFQGQILDESPVGVGEHLPEGQKLGVLSLDSPFLRWNISRS